MKRVYQSRSETFLKVITILEGVALIATIIGIILYPFEIKNIGEIKKTVDRINTELVKDVNDLNFKIDIIIENTVRNAYTFQSFLDSYGEMRRWDEGSEEMVGVLADILDLNPDPTIKEDIEGIRAKFENIGKKIEEVLANPEILLAETLVNNRITSDEIIKVAEDSIKTSLAGAQRNLEEINKTVERAGSLLGKAAQDSIRTRLAGVEISLNDINKTVGESGSDFGKVKHSIETSLAGAERNINKIKEEVEKGDSLLEEAVEDSIRTRLAGVGTSLKEIAETLPSYEIENLDGSITSSSSLNVTQLRQEVFLTTKAFEAFKRENQELFSP